MAVLAGLAARPLVAQASLTITGRVAKVLGADTVPVSGVPFTLHRVGRTAQGAIDSGTTGIDGRFRFRLPADTAALYLVSARYAGIEYFGDPIRAPGSDRAIVLVSDTSSTAPLLLGARHVIVRRPDASGSRAVLDLFTVRNDGPDTRVGRDADAPTWSMPLPRGATDPEVQQGEISGSAIHFRNDSLFLVAPVSPGRKSVMVSYLLPATVDRPTWLAPVDSFDLLVEEDGATVRGAGLVATAPVDLMGSTLRRWTAAPPEGPWGEVRFAGGATDSRGALIGLVVLLGAALTAGAALAFRKSGRKPRSDPTPMAGGVIDALARLDARHQGTRESGGEESWAAYQAERARLKAAAEAAALAGRRRRP